MKKLYVGCGIGLLLIGLFLTFAWMENSQEFVAQTEAALDMEKEDSWRVLGRMNAKEDTNIRVKFKSLKPGAQIMAALISEETYDQFLGDQGKGIESMKPDDFLAKDVAEEGELEWTCDKDGIYYALLTVPWSFDTKETKLTINKNPGYAWDEFKLGNGTLFGGEFTCVESDDEVAVLLVNEYWANKIIGGVTTPKDQVIAAGKGNEGKFSGFISQSGSYYLFLAPTTGHWPIPVTLKILIATVPEGSELPLTLTYSIEASKSGPWYVGVILAIAGIVILILGIRKKALREVTPPDYIAPPPVPEPPSAVKSCSSCGAEIAAYSEFCPKCGNKQASPIFCENCGKEIPASSTFCPYCGDKQESS
jgi:RNA polymerase subunit RPABC4/transcription elongation factor Spt4